MSDIESLDLPLCVRGVAATDLEILLDAVIHRLRACVAPHQPLAGEALVARIRSDVLDCVSALDQLQLTLVGALRL